MLLIRNHLVRPQGRLCKFSNSQLVRKYSVSSMSPSCLSRKLRGREGDMVKRKLFRKMVFLAPLKELFLQVIYRWCKRLNVTGGTQVWMILFLMLRICLGIVVMKIFSNCIIFLISFNKETFNLLIHMSVLIILHVFFVSFKEAQRMFLIPALMAIGF